MAPLRSDSDRSLPDSDRSLRNSDRSLRDSGSDRSLRDSGRNLRDSGRSLRDSVSTSGRAGRALQGGESGVELPSGGGWGWWRRFRRSAGARDSGAARAGRPGRSAGRRTAAGEDPFRLAPLQVVPRKWLQRRSRGQHQAAPALLIRVSSLRVSGGAQCLETALVRTAGNLKTLAPVRKPSENPSHRQSGSSSIVRIKFCSRLGLRVGPR